MRREGKGGEGRGRRNEGGEKIGRKGDGFGVHEVLRKRHGIGREGRTMKNMKADDRGEQRKEIEREKNV